MEKCNNFLILSFTGAYQIKKAEMKLLNRHFSPCEEEANQINVAQCIKKGMDKKLNCTTPDISSGDALPPVGHFNSKICSTEEDFSNYIKHFTFTGYTEKKLYEEFGCIATCQEILKLMHSILNYRVTHHVGSNLLLTSKQKFRFGLACPDLARPKRNFCFGVN